MSKDITHSSSNADSLFSVTEAELRSSYRPGLTETGLWTRGDPIPITVLKAGAIAFQSPEAFLDWMYQTNSAINDDRPIDLLDDSEGVAMICDMLDRLHQAR